MKPIPSSEASAVTSSSLSPPLSTTWPLPPSPRLSSIASPCALDSVLRLLNLVLISPSSRNWAQHSMRRQLISWYETLSWLIMRSRDRMRLSVVWWKYCRWWASDWAALVSISILRAGFSPTTTDKESVSKGRRTTESGHLLGAGRLMVMSAPSLYAPKPVISRLLCASQRNDPSGWTITSGHHERPRTHSHIPVSTGIGPFRTMRVTVII